MAIGAIGGLLESRSAASVFTPSSELAQSLCEPVALGSTTNAAKVWDDWGNKITAWTLVKQIADQAVGRVVSLTLRSEEMTRPSLSAVSVLWEHVCGAWTNRWASRDFRKAWIQQSADRPAAGGKQEDGWDNERETQVDDIVEAVKHDPYLDAHEQRLLGCIVDSGKLYGRSNSTHSSLMGV